MTCIVGFIDRDKTLWMGADSLGSTSALKAVRKDTKLFKKGEFIVGYTSSFRMGQILRFKWKPPVKSRTCSDYEFMCVEVIDSIRKVLKDNGYARIENNEEEIGCFLVGYKGRLYRIDDDLQVGEHSRGFDSCGSGEYFALGALEVLSKLKDFSGEDVCRQALKLAEKFNPYVGGPFKIIKDRGY